MVWFESFNERYVPPLKFDEALKESLTLLFFSLAVEENERSMVLARMSTLIAYEGSPVSWFLFIKVNSRELMTFALTDTIN